MFDIKLTESGDIDYETTIQFTVFRLKFNISQSNVQRISFLTIGSSPIRHSSSQKISFDINQEANDTIKNNNVEGVSELLQSLKIELKTEIEDTYDYATGSLFYKTKHIFYKQPEDLDKIKKVLEPIVYKYFPDAKVDISFEIGDGYFYCQTIKIKVTNDDKTILLMNI